MKFTRDTWLGIGILLALIVVTSAAVLQENKDPQIPYLSTSSAPDGTLALKLWLDKLGYTTATTPTLAFAPDQSVNTLLIIEPFISITANEWKVLDHWVDLGGTLIIAGRSASANDAMRHYDFFITYLEERASELSPAVPLLRSPVITSSIPLQVDLGINTATQSNYLPLVSAKDLPVVLTFKQNEGRVILSSLPELFTNRTLKDEQVAAVLLNILAYTEPGTVWFDEWHHGMQMGEVVGPEEWLQHTPGGRAILFTVFAIFLALVLQGRAFGRPMPLKHELKRRGPMEHVTAIANLNRKAGHRNEVAKQYYRRLKRHLGGRYRLDPSMRDEEYVDALAGYNSSIDKVELLLLLKRLSQTNISEADLLKYSAEAARWMSE